MGACELFGETEFDVEAPKLTINSPLQDFVYNSRSVLFNITSNEPCSLYYIDNINGRGRWSRLGSNIQSYSRKISLKDGHNNITIKAVDINNNEREYSLQFYVDSQKPKIRATEPRSGFISSPFYVQFQEENPESLVLNYGNSITGYREKQLDLGNDCYEDRGRQYCETEVPLEDYDGEEIEYYFELTDIAENIDISKIVKLQVDTTAPDLLNDNVVPGNPDSFWTQGVGRYARYIYFDLNIQEKNFDEVTYTYTDSRGRLKEKRLCSRLKDGKCTTKQSFSRGHYNLNIQITDEAGNSIAKGIEFNVDY